MLVVDQLLDQACRPIRRLMQEHPRVDARLIVAGTATDSGQKVHNLLSATADLPNEVSFLAFADSDARPPADWLRQLVGRLDSPGVVAATAYRWLVPRRQSVPNWLVACARRGRGLARRAQAASFGMGRIVGRTARCVRGGRSALGLAGHFERRPGRRPAAEVDRPNRVRARRNGAPARSISTAAACSSSYAGNLRSGDSMPRCFGALAGVMACLQQAALWIGMALAAGWPALPGGLDGGSRRWLPGCSTACKCCGAGCAKTPDALFCRDIFASTAAARRFAVWCGPLVGLLQCWGIVTAHWLVVANTNRRGIKLWHFSRRADEDRQPRVRTTAE